MTSSPALNAANNQKSSRKHPLKKRSFIGMTRVMALYKMSDKAFRTMCFIIGAHGDNGLIFFKRSTLAELIQGSTNKVDAAILELKSIGLIDAKNWKGRALQFFLTDKCYDDQPREVPQNGEMRFPEIGEPLIKQQKKDLKETTTAPKPKPKPNPKPKTPPEPPAEIAVAQLDEFKKSIHPDIIAAGLSDETILQVCDGADYQEIIWASDKALKPHVDNKPGYFRRMMQLKVIRSNPVKSQQIRLEKVPYPDFYSVPKEHTDKIECYNRNCGHTTCPTILINAEPSEGCIKYCPFLNSRRTES